MHKTLWSFCGFNCDESETDNHQIWSTFAKVVVKNKECTF